MKKYHILLAMFALVFQTNSFAAASRHDTVVNKIAPSDPVNGGDGLKLRKGTGLTLRLIEAAHSAELSEGSIVGLEVYGDVVVNGKVVIATGSYAEGEVVQVKKRGIFGRGAVLHIVPTSLRTVDGKTIVLKGKGLVKKGKDKQLLAFGASTILPAAGVALIGTTTFGVGLIPFVVAGIFVRGGEVSIARDTIVKGVIGENVIIRA